MSRIGVLPIEVPGGVNVNLDGSEVSVKGPKGELSITLRPEVGLAVDGNVVKISRTGDTREARALHGLTRTLVANMVTGVTTGFEKKLSIVGVGYKADVAGDVLNLNLGFSHQINYKLPKGIKVVVDKQTELSVQGSDKQLVGQVAAEIRSYRPPEPYKGKGVRYVDETVRRKAGKAGKATA